MTTIYIYHLIDATTVHTMFASPQLKKNTSGAAPEIATWVAPCPVQGGHNPRNFMSGRPGLPGAYGTLGEGLSMLTFGWLVALLPILEGTLVSSRLLQGLTSAPVARLGHLHALFCSGLSQIRRLRQTASTLREPLPECSHLLPL